MTVVAMVLEDQGAQGFAVGRLAKLVQAMLVDVAVTSTPGYFAWTKALVQRPPSR